MKTFRTMLKTEIKLSVRGMDMVIFGLCLPVAMVVILGAVSGNRPAFEGASYTFFEQSFGALSTIAICAGGVMGLPLLISDYRQKKILKRFQVTPVSPALDPGSPCGHLCHLCPGLPGPGLWDVGRILRFPDAGFCRGFHPQLSAGHAVHVQHRPGSRRTCAGYQDSRNHCQYTLFSHAYIFRRNAAL